MSIPKIEPIRVRIEPIVINDIPINVIQQIPKTSVFDTIAPPVVRGMQQPIIDYPLEQIPAYEPIEVSPNIEYVEKAGGAGGDKEKEEEAEESQSRELPAPAVPTPASIPQTPATPTVIQEVEVRIPFTEIDIPVPSAKQVTLAGTTAVASVSAALLGKSLVEQMLKILKPITKKAILQLKKSLKKDLTPYEEQLYFANSLEAKTVKILKKEQSAEKLRQAEAFAEQLRLRRFWRRG